MKKVISILLSITMLFTMLSCATSAYAATTTSAIDANKVYTVGVSVKYGQTEARSILGMVNTFRTGSDAWYWNEDNKTKTVCKGLKKLSYSYDLEKVAMQRAAEIAITYSHYRPNNEKCFTAYGESGVTYVCAAENIAAGFLTAEDVNEAWIEADKDYQGQSHRRAMLGSKYTAVGMGHVYYNGIHFWTEEFGNLTSSAPAATSANNSQTTKKVKIKGNNIKSVSISSPNYSVSLEEAKAITKPNTIITVNGNYLNKKCTVIDTYSYSIANTNIATLESSKIVPKASGSTTLNVVGLFAKTNPSITVSSEHNYTVASTTKATLSADGKITRKCADCDKVLTTVINRPTSIKLSFTSCVYNGKVRKPTVAVKDSKGNTIASSNYTVTYAKGCKNVGKYAVKITFKGKYSGSKTLYFTIKPKGTSLASLTPASKAITVKWKKQAVQTTGYQVQYATNSKFSSAKTVTITKNTTLARKLASLAGGKKYYVRVRTYKKVGNANYYSAWSTAKNTTTKK